MISGMEPARLPARLIGPIAPDAPFTDATALLGRPAELRARLVEDGYLYLPRFLDPAPLLLARGDILDLCRQAGWLEPGSPLMDGISDGVFHVEGEVPFAQVYRQVIRLPSFNACSLQPRILDLFRRIFAREPFAHPRNICRIGFPGGGRPTQPHQDFHYIRGSAETYTCWIPTSDVPDDLGGLAVCPGSHRKGFLDHQPTVGAGGRGVPCAGPWHGGDFALGDLLLFHSHTIHAARDHRDPQRIRLSFDFRYQPAGEVIEPSSLCYHLEDQPRP